MKPPLVPGALAEPRLRPGPKRLILARGPTGSTLPLGTRYAPSAKALHSLAQLLSIIERDCDPAALAGYYRASPRGDELLLGPLRLMHLHLVHAGSDDIVYLIQCEDASVLIVEVSDHRHLQSRPRGANVDLNRIRSALRRP